MHVPDWQHLGAAVRTKRGRVYSYEVTARNSVGESARSNEASAKAG